MGLTLITAPSTPKYILGKSLPIIGSNRPKLILNHPFHSVSRKNGPSGRNDLGAQFLVWFGPQVIHLQRTKQNRHNYRETSVLDPTLCMNIEHRTPTEQLQSISPI